MRCKLRYVFVAALLSLALYGCGDNAGKDDMENSIPVIEDIPEDDIAEEKEIDEVYVLAYEDAMKEELDHPRYGETKLHYGYGYIDEDDIPELFIIRGTSHIDTVAVYRYDEGKGKVDYVGDFGGYGFCFYVPRENKIIANYGNMGYFYTTVTKISAEGKAELVDAILRNGGNKIESFYGFSMGNFTGAMDWETYDINQFNAPSEEYFISEEEADAIQEKLCANEVKVDMDQVCAYLMEK